VSRVVHADRAPPAANLKAWDAPEVLAAHAAGLAARGHPAASAALAPRAPPQARALKDAPFDALWAAYPRRGRADFVARLGGTAGAALAADPALDDSAARLCSAFHAAGFPWPAGTHADARGRRVSLDARDAARALRARLDAPRPAGGAGAVAGRAGVLFFDGLPGGGASLELWRAVETASARGERFGEAREAWLFELRA